MKTVSDLKNDLEEIDERISQIMTSAQKKIDKLEVRAKRIENKILKIESSHEIHNKESKK